MSRKTKAELESKIAELESEINWLEKALDHKDQNIKMLLDLHAGDKAELRVNDEARSRDFQKQLQMHDELVPLRVKTFNREKPIKDKNATEQKTKVVRDRAIVGHWDQLSREGVKLCKRRNEIKKKTGYSLTKISNALKEHGRI
ncbi:MAG: hypothetical protein H6963_09260 [Chromatiaceae bacterium]|nr:hypothetical protein [Chromatiaceae bacterium]